MRVWFSLCTSNETHQGKHPHTGFAGCCGTLARGYREVRMIMVRDARKSSKSAFSNSRSNYPANRMQGFSTLELVVVLLIILLITAIALPSVAALLRNYRAQGDARSLAGQIALARMRAAADFTQARLYLNLGANTYRMDVWNKANAGCWQTEAATVACDAPNSATVTVPQDVPLSQGDAPGFGGATAPPPGTQAAFGQAPPCLNNAGGAIANTACVVFNSRGIPITAANTATGDDAIYLTNNAGLTYALTISASGKTSIWSYANGNWLQH